MVLDFDNLNDVMSALKSSQDAEEDNRERVRESHHFIDKRDGQWEPSIVSRMSKAGRPRYTFDKCNPIVDQIAGEIQQADFSIKVRPAGGESDDDTADTYDGLIRNIRNISNAEHVFNEAARSMVTGGIDGWEVVQEFVNSDSFDQDLVIKKIPNFVDRVWFDTNSEMQDRSDANWVIVLQTITGNEFEKIYPDKAAISVGDDRQAEVYTHKPDFVTIGRVLFKKPHKKELVLMSNNAVYEVNDEFEKVVDELAAIGVTEIRRRERDSHKVYSRIFSGSEWLTEEEETVFSLLPVIPIYGNFKISENKLIYRGIIEKLIDPQRVYNYARSREIEEGALAPKEKLMMTRDQAQSDVAKLATMNTNNDPVQTYTHVDGQPAPYKIAGAQINQGLTNTANVANQDITEAAGLFAANMGDNPNAQSGVAIDSQISQGNNSTVKWFKSLEVGICHTAKVLIDAIPKVYDSRRQVRLLGEDGASETVTLNDVIVDQQTGTAVEINDLTKGVYDAVCEMGPAFKTQQQEAARAFEAIAAIDPSIIANNKDIYLGTQNFKGMNQAQERARAELFQAGVIPEDQWTEEERQMVAEQEAQAAQQPQEPTPEMMIAMAEQAKGQAEQQQAQNKAQEIQGAQQIKMQELQLAQQKMQLDIAKFNREKDDKYNVDAAKISQEQQKIDMQADRDSFEQRIAQLELILKQQQQQADITNKDADTLNKLVQSTGADAVISPGIVDNIQNQTEVISEDQDNAT